MNQYRYSTLTVSSNLCIFFFILLSKKSESIDPHFEACVPKDCGKGPNISYPFYINGSQQPYCAYPKFELTCGTSSYPILHLPNNSYRVLEIFYNNHSLRVSNEAVSASNSSCLPPLIINNTTLAESDAVQFLNVSELVLFSNCSLQLPAELNKYWVGCDGRGNDGQWDLAMLPNNGNRSLAETKCGGNVVVPVEVDGEEEKDGFVGDHVVEIMKRGFLMNWTASDCSVCENSGGRCGFNFTTYHFLCFCPDRPHAMHCTPDRTDLRLFLGAGIPGALLILCLAAFFIWHRRKWKCVPYFLSAKKSSDPYSKKELEDGSVYYGVHVFTYTELEEATDKFNFSKELGDGGFGTVYYGKIRDGREVAVKRLYENNSKRVEQFKNEIEILTRLRHRNLVSLYGCTSRCSRELLLVYEYISNGTVADHLHGDRAKDRSLTWPIRMSIAIETASALAYLHASDIIHRDVKTTNILLDDKFCVKVADFGLSRLFPNDVTHVSTTPQGTPGYVDPEYHQCYHLTDKSDVYSFGVVLVELISSMPAVDITRHRHEINLGNLALDRIKRSKFNELIDPCLGFESDDTVLRMITSVAELAFRCLQLEKEMRPTMEEVLETLKEIDGGEEHEGEKTTENSNTSRYDKPPPSPESENVVLVKNMKPPYSPDTVADIWVSSSTTNTSV